ncbi:alpha/beta hydrolase [Helicobacter suis]|uniref:alpha/beta hydrolase n=1 Tax=Helicobacter suis TaxID=104628 RepID=UPI001596D633|nr:alpha/beta hydrolase [Helicobacter suis]BCD49492.1 alpha/beta hydrolase [Helicobacter suis]
MRIFKTLLWAITLTFPLLALDNPPPPLIGKKHPINLEGVGHKYLNIAYANQSSAQKLDIYLPKQGKAPYPVILAIHGGGFAFGDKNSGEVNPSMQALKKGYAVISANYRLSKEAPFPAPIFDLKAAVRFIKAHASAYHLNPHMIIAWGYSAGGNLAAMLGTTAGHPELEDLSLGNVRENSHISAVIDFYGPIDFKTMYTQKQEAHMHLRNPDTSPESRYLGQPLSKIKNFVDFSSPQSYVCKKSVPFFIMHGLSDPLVPPKQSAIFAKVLEKAIGTNQVRYVALKGAGHGGEAFEKPENLNLVFDFLKRLHLAP